MFSADKISHRNCTGKKGKESLNARKLGKVKSYVRDMYPVSTSHKLMFNGNNVLFPLMSLSGAKKAKMHVSVIWYLVLFIVHVWNSLL